MKKRVSLWWQSLTIARLLQWLACSLVITGAMVAVVAAMVWGIGRIPSRPVVFEDTKTHELTIMVNGKEVDPYTDEGQRILQNSYDHQYSRALKKHGP